ncbi:hypothetical protein [Aeoliella mucimassa]|uniref:Glycosyl hydrolases family 2, sugar binding domain n=1 Tax=Aeoliella mucimassa TaxID=2527972 RepID=A0A518AMN0_9BACT|nr:hypothetical protein [Aeoliella mucimassa]QDU55989.1 hypothetical protein Pan181_21910 [Aeoliella mucimassa]
MHCIRLRGPWRYEVLERQAGDPTRSSEGKQQLPADWSSTLGDDFRGTVRFVRKFHQPTGLETDQQVWLSIESLVSSARVTLNDQMLPDCEAGNWRHEVHKLLLPSNELTIEVTHPHQAAGPGGLDGLVQLEIQTVRPRPVD